MSTHVSTSEIIATVGILDISLPPISSGLFVIPLTCPSSPRQPLICFLSLEISLYFLKFSVNGISNYVLFLKYIYILWLHPWHVEVSRLGVESEPRLGSTSQLSSWGCLTHCAWPRIEPEPLQPLRLLHLDF